VISIINAVMTTDPLGLSNIDDLGIDYYWLREAELKHSRVAMLAIAGVLFCDQVQIK
jgi:light-harvesting complex I chlorophyll a/b binding protein 1